MVRISSIHSSARCRSQNEEFKRGYNHRETNNFARRWTKVLRRGIGRGGAPRCDELGWVPVDTFLRNDFSWSKELEGKTYDAVHYQNRFDRAALSFRAVKLIEGYRHALASRSGTRRILIVGLYIDPDEVEEMIRIENDPTVYNHEAIRKCYGWIQPVAIRATCGHSFKGENGRPLQVNIDHKHMNMPFTKELAARLGGGYHVTAVRNLLSIVTKGIMPGGTVGNRDHVFFGEYAPWNPVNTCTLNYIGGEDLILVLYVPVARLLKYRSRFTFNSDVVVSETIPFHEVQEAWIAEKAAKGAVASGPRRIMSAKAINEVVCQCENADRAVPPQVLKSKVNKYVQKARDLGRDEIIEELKKRWESYNLNVDDGVVAAELGASLALSRYELFPDICCQTRLCPNCKMEPPSVLLYRPVQRRFREQWYHCWM